jgi:hypothetical protein
VEKKQQMAAVPAHAGAAAPETERRQAFRHALPTPERLAKAVLADLERDLCDLLAADPDLEGVTRAELLDWVAVDVADAVAELAEHGWGER